VTVYEPLIAIVGRPNVGKSTLFNRLIGKRTAIVHDLPGVTRDRHYGTAEMQGHQVRLVDTGGFAPGEEEGMLPLMREQATMAIQEADAIVFLCNARDGATPADEEIARILRRTDKPVFCAANKCDSPGIEIEAMALYSLGFDTVYPIAAAHNVGTLDLVEAMISTLEANGAFHLDDDDDGAPEDPAVKEGPVRGGRVDRVRVCFVGRPNVGKSTLVNRLLGSERVICADQPGTTRDAIDIDFTYQDEAFTLVDTAGLRRKRSITEQIEQYSVSQAVRAIERCHVAVLVLDATQSLADQDAKIAALIEDRGRACVIAINKWDLVEKETMTSKGYEIDMVDRMPYLTHVPHVFISGLTGQRVERLFDVVRKVYANFNRRVGTGELNRWIERQQISHQPPTYRGKRLRIYYAAQVGVRPPQFVMQVNTLGAISPGYEKFLMSKMREQWELEGSPIKLRLKQKAARRARTGASVPDAAGVTGEETWDEGEGPQEWLEDEDTPRTGDAVEGDDDFPTASWDDDDE
jgi:GTP-binding protein